MSLKKKLASSKLVQFMAQNTPFMDSMAKKIVPAVSGEDAIEVAKGLMKEGFLVCMHHLGKASNDPDVFKENVSQIMDVMELLDEENLDQCVSLVPSEMGYLRTSKAGEGYSKQVAKNFRSRMQARGVEERHGEREETSIAEPKKNILMLHASQKVPMQRLQALHGTIARAGVEAAMTLPASLFRSEDDAKAIISQGGNVRLSLIPSSVTDARYIMDEEDIIDNYMKVSRLLLSEDALIQKTYSIFALQDADMANQIKAMADFEGWTSTDFEFELPYGVNTELADQLLADGYTVRILLPFGKEWWPYFMKMSQAM